MVMIFSDWRFIARLSSSSHDFKGMLEVLSGDALRLNPEKVRDLIDEKKRKVGAGYLTDQGALFLLELTLVYHLTTSLISRQALRIFTSGQKRQQ